FVLHARSCLQKKQEQKDVLTWAARHGYSGAAMQMRIIDFQPLTWAEFTVNQKNRCYLCKKHIYRLFLETLRKEGISTLLDGTNIDDLRQGEAGRPGLRALTELGIRTPLADCELNKQEIRMLSRAMTLDTADCPSSSCLATRIPHGTTITAQRLQKIADLEQALEKNGLIGCRVRLDGNSEQSVVVQVQQSDLQRMRYDAMRTGIVNRLKKKGVQKIYLDAEGR
ncbi:MAG: hypothetical protein D3904_10590, partial [Candidatus Electrothrix sp. EH2]|nr:hypothetical protein [Candidatus Electrothrix sp. EH2]